MGTHIDPDDYDLVQVVRMYTPLVKAGRLYRGDPKSGGHDSLIVDPEKNLFNWNSRGVHGDIFEWVKHVYDTDFYGALDIIRRRFPRTFTAGLVDRSEQEYARLSWDLAEEHHANLSASDWDWWESRGVLPSTVRALQLGRHEDWYTIPIPSYDRSYLANYKLRAASPDTEPRYRQYTRNLEPVLYVPRPSIVGDTFVWVAGEIKAMVLAQVGIPTVSSSTGCATWRREWGAWFRERRVVQCFDPGEQDPAARVREQLMQDVPSARVTNLAPPYDIDDWIVQHGATIQEVKEYLNVDTG